MCNCGKRTPRTPPPPPPTGTAADKTQTFTLTTPDRRTQTFGSRLEATAARVRAGGVGQITPSS